MPTRLQFDQTHSITVEEDLGEVESAVRSASSNDDLLVSFTSKGEKVWVNAAQIRVIAEALSGSASV